MHSLTKLCRSSLQRLANISKSVSSARQTLSSASQQNQHQQQQSATYRCTLDDGNGILSREQREFYEQNGYLVIKGMVGHADLEKYHRRFEEYASGARQPPSEQLILLKEVTSLKSDTASSLSPDSLYKINELYEDPVFFEYCRMPAVLDHVQCITGPNIVMCNSMLINKPPDKGTKSSRHPLHQDIYYFPFRPADRIVCAWTAMEHITRDNGCLVVVPGSHRTGQLLEHEKPNWEGGVNLFYDGVKDKSYIESRVHLHMEPGDCVLFHSALIHGSGINRTKGYRKAISAHYAPSDAQFIDISGTQTEKLGKEAAKVLQKKYKTDFEIDYSFLWKVRSRLVRGEGGWEV